MKEALCTLNQVVYKAENFAYVDGFEIKRKNLVCPECGYPAFFTKESYDKKRMAHFKARPHRVGCSLAVETSDNLDTNEEMPKEDQSIRIDFNYGAHESYLKKSEEGVQEEYDNKNNSSIATATAKTQVSRRLSSLLKLLLQENSLANQDIRIASEFYEDPIMAKRLFKRTKDIIDVSNGKVLGVFGQIVSTGVSDQSLWLNFTNDIKDFSIVIDSSIVNDFLARFSEVKKIEEIGDDLNGLYVLCFGDVKKSSKNKLYVSCDDLKNIVLI